MAQKVLSVTDNLATSLQATKQTASSGKELSAATVKHLEALRKDEEFDSMYEEALACQERLGKFSDK